MFLDRYLTEYDDSLSGESYIDPLGSLVIWSAYGQQIFRNRVNSISNDVRNYTLNLFNHYIIRRLVNDDSVQLSRKLRNQYGAKNTLNFKYACLLYLENLFVYSILQYEGNKGVEGAGVLGSSKARRLWAESESDPEIIFTHEKSGEILVRQLSLGVSGRYKTPMMEIGYFDSNYHYNQPSAVPLWQGAEQFVMNQQLLRKLADALIKHLKELWVQNSSSPSSWFSEVPEVLRKNFANAFASSTAVGGYARPYWLSVTGLDSGAAGALLQVLDENATSDIPLDMAAQTLVERALKKEMTSDERMKLTHITVLEPFLSDTMLLFTLLVTKKSGSVNEVASLWQQFGRDEHTLPRRAQQLRNDAALIKVLKGTALARLQSMLRLADTVTLENQIMLLLDYHDKVMRARGQVPWLTINSGGLVKVHVRPTIMPNVEDWPQGEWYHSYYMPQFKSLVRGFQGEVA